MEPVRVAQVIGKLSAGGVEAVIYNYYQHMDHEKVQFDFYIDEDSSFAPRQELMDMGARYFVVPPYQRPFQYMAALTRLFRENQYPIVHSNMNTLSVFSLFAAWRAGVPVRICHNHSTAGRGEAKKNSLKYLLRPFAKIFATDYFACSRHAGEWLFGKAPVRSGRVVVVNNAINIARFQFDAELRNVVRKELCLEGKLVVGHVGRFCVQKNHDFLVDVFARLHGRRRDAVLLLIGHGERMEEIKRKVHELGLEKAVRFLGVQSNVHRLYQAMDVFALPSIYEGLPVVGLEAQTAGLPCVLSDCVPPEGKLGPSTVLLPLSAGAAAWADQIESCGSAGRQNCLQQMKTGGFDIRSESQKLQSFYQRRGCP